jgi:UDP-N-acetylmuramoyl-L-alanyl-D-glutamate--2,6-diaminopimelate ligase
VVNTDCPYGRRLIDIVREMGLPTVTFGEDRSAKVRIVAFDQGFEHSTLTLELEGERYEIGTNLIGDYNASNMAAAFAALVSLELEPQEAAAALSEIPSVPGRLESVGTPDIAVLVDYAHTGEGLRNLLSALRGFVENDLWVVFGCGGGKDPRKREGMGRAAKELADRIVLTSDNPKNEDPAKIIEDILASGCEPELIELDRGRAIEQTLRKAQKGDVVVLVGKGHEDYQIIGNQTFYFSDREEALKWREQGLLDR